jgi:hypothetical protein
MERRYEVKRGLLNGLIGVLTCCVAGAPAVAADQPNAPAGMIGHTDPATGAIVKEAAPGSAPLVMNPAELNARSTSHQGLTEQMGTESGGGVMIDLKGRFQSPLIGSIGPDGKPRMGH